MPARPLVLRDDVRLDQRRRRSMPRPPIAMRAIGPGAGTTPAVEDDVVHAVDPLLTAGVVAEVDPELDRVAVAEPRERGARDGVGVGQVNRDGDRARGLEHGAAAELVVDVDQPGARRVNADEEVAAAERGARAEVVDVEAGEVQHLVHAQVVHGQRERVVGGVGVVRGARGVSGRRGPHEGGLGAGRDVRVARPAERVRARVVVGRGADRVGVGRGRGAGGEVVRGEYVRRRRGGKPRDGCERNDSCCLQVHVCLPRCCARRLRRTV